MPPDFPTINGVMEIIRKALGGWGYLKRTWAPNHLEHALAAADAVEDAELALEKFLHNVPAKERTYLELYGALQAAVIQQDSANALRIAFGLPATAASSLPAGMKHLREVRNRISGHPADLSGTRKKQPPVATMISRFSIRTQCLDVTYLTEGFEVKHEKIDLIGHLQAHLCDLRGWMGQLANQVAEEEKMFRSRIVKRGDLVSLMGNNWQYFVQKIDEASWTEVGDAKLQIGVVGAGSLLGILDDVEKGLSQQSLTHLRVCEFPRVRAALEHFRLLIEEGPADRSEEKWRLDLYAYAQFIDSQISALAENLGEHDRLLREDG